MRKLSFRKAFIMLFMTAILVAVVSCDENELPGVGDVIDENPPVAGFAALISDVDFLQYNVFNSSSSATMYQWTIPDNVKLLPDSIGSPSREELLKRENLVAIFPSVGSYDFTLKATDNNQISNSFTETIEAGNVDVEPAVPSFDVESEPTDALIKILKSTSANTARIEWDVPDTVKTLAVNDDDKSITLEFPDFGSYMIGLTAYNLKREAVSINQEVTLSGFVPKPTFGNPGFEEIANPDYTDPAKKCSCSFWRNSKLGRFGGTSGDERTGIKSLKFDANQARAGYQEIEVVADTEYKIDFYFASTRADSNTGKLEVRILKGKESPYSSISEVEKLENNVVPVTYFERTEGGTGSKEYNAEASSVTFTTGETTTKVAILFRVVLKEGGPGSDGDYTYAGGNSTFWIDDFDMDVVR